MERRILVVEDSPTQAEHLRLLLEGEGYQVEVARTGREALQRLRLAPPDLIVSDVVMPEMDGYALCRAVKSTEVTRRVPFVFLTERKTALDILRGLECGADNFITKPFEGDYLVERVRRIFEQLALRERGHLDVEITLRFGGRQVVINADKQQIVEMLFSTFEELCRLNERLAASQRMVEEHARTLEAKVAERTRELRSLFEGVPVGLFRVTPDGQLLDANPAMAEMLGYPDRESLMAAGEAALYVDAEDRSRWRAVAEREGLVRDFEARFRRRDGSVFWLRISGRVVRDAAGHVLHYEGAAEDVTARKRAEEALRQSEKLAAMGTLLAGVAHELNNPLSVIVGRTALLREALGEGALAQQSEEIAQAAARAARIVRNFLALARQHPPERQEVRVNEVVKEAVELLAYPLRVDGVEVRLDLAPDLPVLWADPHELHQVVLNLVANAHQAMHETAPPRRLTLTTRSDPEGRRVTLAVADTGPGMPPEIRARIFEPFFTTKPPGKGTGLGLPLCHGILESHGGTIRVESEPGAGAVFRVELPVGTAPVLGRTRVRTAPAGPPVCGAILVVDDEPLVAQMLQAVLAADGHQVETAGDGVQALDLLRARTFDLVLSDLRMPGLDGPGLYREVERSHPALASRFIFLTGDTLSTDASEFLARTGVPSVSKPFAIEEIRRAVQRVLRAEP